jgi:hypothetical protein
VRLDRSAVRQQFAGVLEDDDAVAEEAPALLGVARNRAGGFVVSRVSARTGGVVLAAHGNISGCGVNKVTCDQ